MTTHAAFDCCARQAELDRLICRLAAHDSYSTIMPAAADTAESKAEHTALGRLAGGT